MFDRRVEPDAQDIIVAGSFLQYTTEPWTQNPGGDETSTNSAGSQNSCVTIWMPNLLTFSVGTISKTPGF